jgi:hypothetical protein
VLGLREREGEGEGEELRAEDWLPVAQGEGVREAADDREVEGEGDDVNVALGEEPEEGEGAEAVGVRLEKFTLETDPKGVSVALAVKNGEEELREEPETEALREAWEREGEGEERGLTLPLVLAWGERDREGLGEPLPLARAEKVTVTVMGWDTVPVMVAVKDGEGVALLFPLSVALWPLGVSLRVAVRESERVFSADAVFEAVLERVEVGVPVALGVPPRAAEVDTVRVGVREGRGVRLEEGEGVGEAVWDGEALGEGRALGQGVGESVGVGVLPPPKTSPLSSTQAGEAEGEAVEK